MNTPTLLLILSLALATATADSSLRQSLPRSPQCLSALHTCLPLAAAGNQCPFLPIRPEARNDPTGPDGFTLTQIRRGVYQYYDGFFTTMMIKSASRFAFVDLPDSPGSRLPNGSMTRLTQAAEMLIGDVTPRRFDIVYSHFHIDHIGATGFFIDYFQAKFPHLRILTWGSEVTRKQLAEFTAPLAPPPNRVVGPAGRTLIFRHGLSLELKMIAAHTDGDIVALVRRSRDGEGVVMFSDVLFPRYAPMPLLAGADSAADYLSSQEEILKLDFETIVTGHLRLGTRRDLRINVAYTRDLIDAAQTGVNADNSQALAPLFARFMDPNDVVFGNSAFLARDSLRGVAINKCAEIMLEKWGCRIAGVDFTVVSNCNLAFNLAIGRNGPNFAP